MSNPAGLTLDEALERIEAGWHVKPGFLELLERDYDSAQRKRYLRLERRETISALTKNLASLNPSLIADTCL